MKSLHNLTGISKIFKYQDFTESEPKETKDESQAEPFLTFQEEDLLNAKEIKMRADAAGVASVQEPPVITRDEAVLREAELKADEIIRNAKEEAAEILAEARKNAEALQEEASEQGHREGYEKGFAQGEQAGEEELLAAINERYSRFFKAVNDACESIDAQKQEILQQHVKELSDLSIAIAEKVVHVALESCGEVIKRMIIATASPAVDKQWAKVMISSQDFELMRDDGIDIRKALLEISKRVELVIVEDAAQGTCLVEFPDQVIDAGAGTQLRNIKEIVRSAERE